MGTLFATGGQYVTDPTWPGFVVKASTAQTQYLQRWQDANANDLGGIDIYGNLHVGTLSLTSTANSGTPLSIAAPQNGQLYLDFGPAQLHVLSSGFEVGQPGGREQLERAHLRNRVRVFRSQGGL